MKRLLIIRSVSFSQLDINIQQIKKKFPDYQIDILTNYSGVDTAKKYTCINNVYIYNFDGNFNKKNIVKAIQDQKFDVIIILVNNVSGLFFENSISFGCSIKSEEYYICNIASDLKRITKLNLIKMNLLDTIIKICSCFLTVPIGISYIIVCFFKNK